MRAITLVCLFAIAMISTCVQKHALNANISAYNGKISVNGGSVTSTGHAVEYGDRIETGNNSFCDIQINDKSVIRLGPKTVFIFNVSDTESNLILESGSLSAVTRKIFTTAGKYHVMTPAVTAAVRGTSFFINVEKKNSVYFCVCNGKIDLAEPDGGKSDTVTSSHHAGRRYVKNDDGTITVDNDPGMKYHDDSMLENLASSINEKIDWSKPDSN